ncbi:hypothetical protein G7Y89_g8632 [Cudoniella acicularis]|uniref:Fucose-specific lectin n=1 Tax=Cudoniella acicularis TaxID=354080 RepID=A0A8H4W0W2_9HELO|nr:hypothetical protein G7Y89_g8632 [Cudoniella acicularis]
MDFSSLDAVEFFLNNKRYIHLFYQTADSVLRRSCYEQGQGWFTYQNGILATNAKKKTPVTATRWVSGSTVHIRVYYLDEIDSPLNVAGGSRLAIARPEKDGETIRLFYQQKKNAGNCPLREVAFESDADPDDEGPDDTTPTSGRWILRDFMDHDAEEGTGVTAVSAAKTSNVCVYYEGKDRYLRVNIWKAEERTWKGSLVTDKQFILASGAPIAAICWYANETAMMRDLRIRVFTILKSNSAKIVELVRNGDSWRQPKPVVSIPAEAQEKPCIGVTRNNTKSATNPISVFYMPQPNVINLAHVSTNNAATRAELESLKPQGIPTSRGLPWSPVDAGNTSIPASGTGSEPSVSTGSTASPSTSSSKGPPPPPSPSPSVPPTAPPVDPFGATPLDAADPTSPHYLPPHRRQTGKPFPFGTHGWTSGGNLRYKPHVTIDNASNDGEVHVRLVVNAIENVSNALIDMVAQSYKDHTPTRIRIIWLMASLQKRVEEMGFKIHPDEQGPNGKWRWDATEP